VERKIEDSTNLVKAMEKDSLLRYTSSIGVSAEWYAKNAFESIKDRYKRVEKESDGIISYRNYYKEYGSYIENPTVDSFLEFTRMIFLKHTKVVIKSLVDFFSKYNYLWGFNITLMQKSALNKGIDVKSEDWLYNYLRSIPVLQLFDNEFNAYVDKLENGKIGVVLNRKLNHFMELYLCPLLINLINIQIGKNIFIDLANIKDVEKEAAMIAELAEICSGRKTPSEIKLNTDLCKVTRNVAYFNLIIHSSIVNFILFHEYSHYIMRYTSLGNRKLEEISADVLAFNVMMNEESFSDIAVLKAISPVYFLFFVIAIGGLSGLREEETHPNPFIRIKYLERMANLIMDREEENVKTFWNMIYLFYGLFGRVFCKQGNENAIKEFVFKMDESFLEGYEFKVVPLGGSPLFIEIDAKTLNRFPKKI
jgi:hypothetical protein